MDLMQREYNSYKRKMAKLDREFKAINPNLGDMKPVSFEEFIKTYFGVELVK